MGSAARVCSATVRVLICNPGEIVRFILLVGEHRCFVDVLDDDGEGEGVVGSGGIRLAAVLTTTYSLSPAVPSGSEELQVNLFVELESSCVFIQQKKGGVAVSCHVSVAVAVAVQDLIIAMV